MTDDEAIRFLNDWEDGTPKSFGNDFTAYMKGNPCCISLPIQNIIDYGKVAKRIKMKYTKAEQSAMVFMDYAEQKAFRKAKLQSRSENQLTVSKKEKLLAFIPNALVINRSFEDQVKRAKLLGKPNHKRSQ